MTFKTQVTINRKCHCVAFTYTLSQEEAEGGGEEKREEVALSPT